METPVKATAATEFKSLSITLDENGKHVILINGETPENLASVYFSWYAPDRYGCGGTNFEYSTQEPQVAGQMSARQSFSLCKASVAQATASMQINPIPNASAHKPPVVTVDMSADLYKQI